MNIDLSRLYEKSVNSIPVKGKLEKDSIAMTGRTISFKEPVSYKGNIYKVDGDKLLHLDIDYEYEEACGRCLESFATKNTVVLSGKLAEETDEDISDEENIILYKDGKLDLAENIISTIILALPMKPLCDEDCKGLCPRCGTNHNVEECECVVEDVDPRLEKLKNFFPKE